MENAEWLAPLASNIHRKKSTTDKKKDTSKHILDMVLVPFIKQIEIRNNLKHPFLF